jgi:peroxiredoxin
MRERALLKAGIAAALIAAGSPGARGDAGGDWAQIEAMEKARPVTEEMTREQAAEATVDFLGKQEQALRAYIADYPSDAHEPDAKMRLAHLLATRADLDGDPGERRKADAVLDELESEPAIKDRKADVEFARISIFMQRVDAFGGTNMDALVEKARAFAKAYPDDRRVAPLLVDVASGLEDQPKLARSLLEEAQPKAKTPELQARIGDDLKRLALAGKPLAMKWTAVDGTPVDLQNYQGKVVLVFFFASWSPPSMQQLDWVRQLVQHFPAESLQAVGISLDNDPVSLPGLLADHQITWPVYCDGAGWRGALVRSLGINALPDLWVVDRDGILRALDVKGNAVQLIQQVARDSGQ